MARGSSKQYIGLVDLLCEGPIRGLVNGKNSVYINDVPFENSSLVGTYNEEQTSVFKQPTLSYSTTNSTSIDVSGVTLTDKDIGKFAHVEIESVTGCTLARSGISFSGVNETYLSISGTGIDSAFDTLTDNLSYVKVKSSTGVSFYADAKYHSGTSVTLYVSSRSISNQLITSTGWTITLIKAVEVTGRTDSDTFTIGSAFHTSNLTDVNFFFSDAPAHDSTTTGIVNNISKFDGSTLQFRKGTLNQAPMQQVNSLSGGVTVTGSGNGRSLQQSTDASSTYGLTLYDSAGYPENQSFPADVGNAALVISSGSPAGGMGFGLNAAQRKQASELNIRINYSALITHNNENGDKSSASAIYVFLLEIKKPGEGSFNDPITLFSNHGGQVVHTDQTTAPVSFDHIIGLDRFKPFDDFQVTIVRLTRDAGLPVRANGSNGGETDRGKFTLQAASSIAGANLSATIKDKFNYPYTAHAAVSFSSKTYDSLPSRSYLLQGLKVQIPTSYTPREYTDNGVAVYEEYWNGQFKTEQLDNNTTVPLLYYTDNPAWVFYDIVTNNRYGAGEWIESDFINKFALYRIAKYCDELVPSGKKDANNNDILEPRFRANLYLAKSTEVYKVLKDMATIFTGMLYWLDGKLTAVQDVPSEPIYNFSKANVVDGVFNYESTGRKTRVNQVVVTWNDPTANYEPVPLIVEDREAIVKAGRIISQNSVAMGATSEGQALRYGRWKLWTAQNQKEVVSFKTGLQGAFIRPGDIINVQDRDRYGVDYSGLTSSTTSATASSVTLDRKLTNVANSSKHKFSTIVDSYAAFYTGLNPVTIDGETYNKGDRIIGQVYLYDPDSNTYGLDNITTEKDASNAFYSNSNNVMTPLQTEWKPYTYVLTKVVTLNNTGDVSVVTIDTTVDASIPEIERTNYAGDAPASGTLWVLQALDANDQNILGSKKEYRVLGIQHDDEKNTYTITGVEYYIGKYDAVDKDYALGATPSNVFPTIEDPDEEVPAPENIYIAIDSDSSKPGEELTVNWLIPQETFTDTDGNEQTRDYSFIDKYELYHDVPHIDSPILTSRPSYRFDSLEDGLYTFRVRTVSRKQDYSDFVSTQYDVNDQYGTNVERIVGGLPRGIYANSQIEYSYNSDDTLPEAVRFIEESASGFSKAHALADTSSASSLVDVSVAGLGSSELRREQEWYFLLLDGGASKVYWDTDSLANLSFYRKISGSQWRGSSQTWGSIGSVSVAADSTKLTGSGFNSNLEPRDIITFENTGSVKAAAINSVSTSGSTYQLTIASADGTPASHLISTGDKIKVENATFTGSGTDLNGKEYYVAVSGQNVQLYTDEARTEAVTIGKTWSEGGFFRRVGIPAAKVIAVVSDTQAILDRSFSTSYSTTGYSHTYRPDYKDDAVFGRVRWHSYDEQTQLNSYRVESFITLEPNLRAGKAVIVTPSVETIRYESEADGTTTQSTSFTSLTATVSAVGFSNPEFRLVSFTFPGDVDVDSTVLDQSIVDNFVGPDDTGGFTKEFTINSDSSVAYSSTINNVEYAGTPILIKAEVREKTNVGINSFGTGDIIRIKDGAAGTQGRTVELNAEDYTIVYDDDGANPSFEGADSNITLTATSRNFEANPLFRITVNSSYAPSSTFSDWVDGTSGTDNTIYSTYITPPSSKPSYTSKLIEIQVAERPDNWNSSTQQGEDSDGNAINPVVGASDSISILYLQTGEGGIAVSNSNSAHSYTTDADGEFTTSTIPNSGTTLEVLIGGKRATYVGGTGVSSGGFSGTLGEGDWYVVSAVSSTSEFSAGNITESNDILTIAPVAVDNTIGYGEESETITWTIRVGTRSGTAVDLTTIQSLTKSIAGVDAKAFSISPSHQVVVKNATGTTITPSAVEFTHSKSNLTGNPTWSSSSDLFAAETGGSALSGNDLIRSNVYVRPSTSDTSITVSATLGTFSDSESVEVVQDGLVGADAIIVSLSNDNHTFTADSDGAVSTYTGSGTDISVYEGATKLSYDGSGTSNGTWTVSASASGITKGGVSSLGSTSPYDARFSAASGMADATDSATITFSISGKTADGTSFTASKVQTFSKAEAGTAVTITSTSTSNGVTTVTFSDNTTITISDGDEGTSEGVLVVYADDASGTNKSATRGSGQNYVLYYEWTGTKPSVSSVTGTWVLFVGDDGETQGVIPVYSSVASPTGTGQLSLTYSSQEYITFFEYTGTKPTSVTSAMVSQTYVPFVGDDGTSVTITSTSTSAGVTTVNFSDGSSITINDGDDGQTQGVKVFYADDASGTNQSTTQGNRTFVKYVEYTGTAPSSGGTSGFVQFIGDDGQTKGVIPVYSSVASPTSTSQLSLSPGTKEYVTFFEYTGNTPTSVLSSMVSATYVKFVGDDGVGEDGDDGLRTADGYVYYNTAVSSASNAGTPGTSATYTWSSGGITGMNSGWQTSPPEMTPGSQGKYYYSKYRVVQSTSTDTTNTPTFGSVTLGHNFTGLVTFASGDFSQNGSTITQIDGGNIATNTITATQLQISTSTGASTAGIHMDYNSGSPRIKINDGTATRVILGYLS